MRLIRNTAFIFITISLWFVPFLSHPQNTDSLMAVWHDKTQADSTRLKAIKSIIQGKYLSWNYDTIFSLTDSMYALAKASDEKNYQAKAFHYKGSLNTRIGNYSKGMGYLYKGLELYKEAGNKDGVAGMYYLIAQNLTNQKNFPKALEYLNQSLILYEEIGGEFGTALCYMCYGFIFHYQGNYNQAIKNYERSLKISKKLNNQGYSLRFL